MITDIQQLINACEQELHDREYHAHHADFITNEWKGISQCKQPLSADSRAAFPGQSGPY